MRGIPMQLLNQTCDIERPESGAADAYGQPVTTWRTAASGVRCRIEGVGGKEFRNGMRGVDVTRTLYLCAGADITEQDRVVIGETSFEVLYADPLPGGVAHHVECQVKELRA